MGMSPSCKASGAQAEHLEPCAVSAGWNLVSTGLRDWCHWCPVIYNIPAIRKSLAQRTKELVAAEAKHRAASKQEKQDFIEIFSDAQHVRAGS